MKHRLPSLIAIVILAFLLNWAVCWACAWRSRPADASWHSSLRQPVVDAPTGYWTIGRLRWFGNEAYTFMHLRSSRLLYESYLASIEELEEESLVNVREPVELLPSWSEADLAGLLEAASDIPATRVVTRYEQASGWPLPAMRMTSGGDDTAGVWRAQVRSGLELVAPNINGNGGRVVPVRPLIVGMTVNILVYAVGLFILQVAAGRVRRARRRRRGRCPACGYDVRETAGRCPECGHDDGDGR